MAVLADKVHMTEEGLSRYFRQRTRKSISEVIQEIRIGEAKRLLLQTDLQIGSIAYDCGFQNLSNFNRQFRKIATLTPAEYRKAELR